MPVRKWEAREGMWLAHLPKHKNPIYRSHVALCGVDIAATPPEDVGDRPKCGICKERQNGLQGEG